MRGLAILLVLLVHFGDYEPTRQSTWAQIARAFIGFGWTGVDLFFVLSGCLITGILLGAKGSPDYFRSFYIRRALRILPLYYLVVFGYFVVLLPVAHLFHLAMDTHTSEQTWYWFYLSNWRIAFAPYAALEVSHFWTLAIEEQFYLLWPVIVFLCSEKVLLRLCCAVILGCLVLRSLPVFQNMQTQYEGLLYTLTPFRVDSLAWGALVALVLRSPRLRIVATNTLGWFVAAGIAALAAVVLTGHSIRFYSRPMGIAGFTAIAELSACLVFYAAVETRSWLCNPVLVRFGKYSYSIYVLHWPLSIYLDDFFQNRIKAGGGFSAAMLSLAVGTLLSFVLGFLSWNFFERHFLRLKARFPYWRELRVSIE